MKLLFHLPKQYRRRLGRYSKHSWSFGLVIFILSTFGIPFAIYEIVVNMSAYIKYTDDNNI